MAQFTAPRAPGAAKEMQRLEPNVPLLVGGATTSDKHTAVKIAPHYDNPVIHVLDASRSAGVVGRAISEELKDELIAENRAKQKKLVDSYQNRDIKLVSLEEAKQKRFATDWKSLAIDQPSFTGAKVLDDVSVEEIVPYIDWSPFFMTWELKGKYPAIFENETVGSVAKELFDNASKLLRRIIDEKLLKARGVYGFWPAASDGEDVVLYSDESRKNELTRFHFLRQQWQRKGRDVYRSLADYIAPIDSGRQDYIGAFAVTAGHGCDELAAAFDAENDDYNSIMTKAIADRLAEAFAEMMHQRARTDWQYGKDEGLNSEELIDEKYRGIRPAAGYPSCPDHTEKRALFELLQAEQVAGISLTESFAMAPGASVSGLYFAHPEARYFAVDRISKEQVEDYAKRQGVEVGHVERWLAPNLGYSS